MIVTACPLENPPSINIAVDKDKDDIKEFMCSVLSHVDYKDGKIIVDLDVLVF